MSYQPDPTSVAGRVLAYLATKPSSSSVTNAELSHKLGVPSSSFDASLKLAVNAGLVHKRGHDIAGGRSTTCWVLGPRVVETVGLPQAQAHEPPPAPAAEPPVRAFTMHASEPADPVTTEIKILPDQQETLAPTPAAGAEPFACALFNDGRLYLELGIESMTLQVEHTRALLAYLERVAMP